MKIRSGLGRTTTFIATMAVPLLSMPRVQAADAEPPTTAELRRLIQSQKEIQEKLQALEQQTAQLAAQRREIEELKRKVAGMPPSKEGSRPAGGRTDTLAVSAATLEPPDLKETRGGQQGTPSVSPDGFGAVPKETVGEREKKSAPLSVADVVRDQSILTPKGDFVFTPSLAYTNDSNIRTAITGFSILPALLIGIFDVRKINRDTFVGRLTGRYGLTDNLDVELQVPYVYRSDSVLARPLGVSAIEDTRYTASGGDIGDVEAAVRYQFARPNADWPYVTAGLRVKSNTGKSPYDVQIDTRSQLPEGDMPTGTGFWGVRPSVLALLPSDPVVFFGELSYQWNIKGDTEDYGTIDPGDYVGVDFGMGFGLNEKASFTLGYQHRTVLKTTQDGREIGDVLQVGSFVSSFAYKYTRNASANLSVAAGLTDDSPDLQLTLSFPTSF